MDFDCVHRSNTGSRCVHWAGAWRQVGSSNCETAQCRHQWQWCWTTDDRTAQAHWSSKAVSRSFWSRKKPSVVLIPYTACSVWFYMCVKQRFLLETKGIVSLTTTTAVCIRRTNRGYFRLPVCRSVCPIHFLCMQSLSKYLNITQCIALYNMIQFKALS